MVPEMKKIRILLVTFLITFSTQVNSEVIEITCKSAASKPNGGSRHLIDITNKRLKSDCDNCNWWKTLFWDDYIIVATLDKGSMGGDMFMQSAMMVLERDTMLMIGSTITDRDFRHFERNQTHKPHTFSLKCVRGF